MHKDSVLKTIKQKIQLLELLIAQKSTFPLPNGVKLTLF